jgi:hypothetical protein
MNQGFRSDAKLLALGSLVIVIGYFLEGGGVFLYSGYELVKLGGVLTALSLLVVALLMTQGKRRRPVMVAVALGLAIATLAWRLESYLSSPRKEFYLRAEQVKPGQRLGEAEQILAGYRTYSEKPGWISFCLRSGLHTEDVLLVRYDPRTEIIEEAELSLD